MTFLSRDCAYGERNGRMLPLPSWGHLLAALPVWACVTATVALREKKNKTCIGDVLLFVACMCLHRVPGVQAQGERTKSRWGRRLRQACLALHSGVEDEEQEHWCEARR